MKPGHVIMCHAWTPRVARSVRFAFLVEMVGLPNRTKRDEIRDGPLEKWWGRGGGGWGKSQKKIHARENAKKKNSCKEEGKEKKFMQKEGPIVIFI